MVTIVFTVSPISRVNLQIFLVLLGPLVARLKESSPGLISLYAYVCDCKQIGHSLGLLHGDLLHGLEIVNLGTEGIDDLDFLDIWDSIPGIVEMRHVVPETFIMPLSDGF
jgi:hypothetical protein